MAFSAEEVASSIFDDFGLSDGDSNDKGNDIYGYLGEPIVLHKDLILGHELPNVRLDEDISEDESDQDSGSDDGLSDSTGKSDNSSEQDSESKQDEDERVCSVSTPQSISRSEQDTEREQDEDNNKQQHQCNQVRNLSAYFVGRR